MAFHVAVKKDALMKFVGKWVVFFLFFYVFFSYMWNLDLKLNVLSILSDINGYSVKKLCCQTTNPGT